MPQLDKYIFFYQISTLILLFSLIYFYIRGTIIPKLNFMLKYRHKKISKLHQHDVGHKTLIKLTREKFIKFGIQYFNIINNSSNALSVILLYYNQFTIKNIYLFTKNYYNWSVNQMITISKSYYYNLNNKEFLRKF